MIHDRGVRDGGVDRLGVAVLGALAVGAADVPPGARPVLVPVARGHAVHRRAARAHGDARQRVACALGTAALGDVASGPRAARTFWKSAWLT